MKNVLLKGTMCLAMLATSMSCFAQESTSVKASFECYVRSDAANAGKSWRTDAAKTEMVNGTNKFYSMMTFAAGQPNVGNRVKSASLRLVTYGYTSDNNIDIYAYDPAKVNEKTTYTTAQADIETAMGKNAIATFAMKGRKGMTIIHKNNTTSAYQNVAAWTNTIDLTDFMRSQTEENVALLLAKQKYEENNAYCRTWTAHLTADQTMATTGTVISKEDLIPLLTIEYESVYTLKVTDAKAATLVLPYDAKISEGVKAYTLTYTSGDKATAKEVKETIPANTPVLINAEAGNYDFVSVGTYNKAEAPSKDALTGVYAETTVPQNAYVLQNQDGKVAFYKVSDNTNIKLKACQAYLVASQTADAKSISIDFSGTTGITDVQAQEKTQNEAIYTLGGVRVNKAQLQKNQVYISKGKAFVAK